jgi:proline iminopeptidase
MRFELRLNTLIACLLTFILIGCTNLNKPCESSLLKASRSSYVQVDNGKLFYQRFGSGTPIVILHGGPGLDQTYLLPQILELATDHEVILYDQRGSGKSLETKINSSYINIDQFTKDLEDLRTHLKLQKFVLAGHSWGGLLAMNYATQHPNHLSGLIFISSAPADYKGQKAFIDKYVQRTKPINNDIKALSKYNDFKELSDSEISDLYKTLFSVYFFNPDEVNKLNLNMNAASARSGFKVMEHMSQTSWLKPHINLVPGLKKLEVPTLVIHGRQDIVPAWTAQEIKDSIPNAEIAYLEQCGHFPYIEKPKPFFAKIRQLISKISLP